MLPLVLVAAFCVTHVLGRSPCPPKESIYPCRCLQIGGISRRPESIVVTCFKLQASNNLSTIFNNLRGMYINHFSIYDSFWESNELGSTEDEQNKLPANWIALLRIREIEIVDSVLSRCFACDTTLGSRNYRLRRFLVINSSSSESICTVCNNNERANFSWIASFQNLEHFEFSSGKLSALTEDFFPSPVNELIVLNLTKNQIATIDSNALTYLSELKELDLSHNAIRELGNTFGGISRNLLFLDLSYNQLKSIGLYHLNFAPRLRHLDLRYNRIEDLPYVEWRLAFENFRTIDFTGNPILCDCKLKWTKNLIRSETRLGGICSTPKKNFFHLRRLYRYMPKNCFEDVATRSPSLRRRRREIEKKKRNREEEEQPDPNSPDSGDHSVKNFVLD